jgi:hypothetical protein
MRFDLIKDRKGMVWDLLLYVPTVTALAGLSAYFWYADQPNYSYLLLFLTTFFLLAGTTRILTTRLMVWPTAPVAIEVAKNMVALVLRNGSRIELLKDLKYYPEYSGKTFGLSGMDGAGKRLQFVFHRGQFPDDNAYQQAIKALRDR